VQGSIPNGLLALTKLTWLDFRTNLMTGSIPNLSPLSALTAFDMRYNFRLKAGTIPDFFDATPNLEWLDLANTNRIGTIPTSVGRLSLMSNFDVSRNEMSGTIPNSLASQPLLRLFSVYDNAFTGTVPAGLESSQLYFLSIDGNNFSGSLQSFDFAGVYNVFYVTRNRFYGNIGSFTMSTSSWSEGDISPGASLGNYIPTGSSCSGNTNSCSSGSSRCSQANKVCCAAEYDAVTGLRTVACETGYCESGTGACVHEPGTLSIYVYTYIKQVKLGLFVSLLLSFP
jgi:hypothetical protein